jgi:hypothetical protein
MVQKLSIVQSMLACKLDHADVADTGPFIEKYKHFYNQLTQLNATWEELVPLLLLSNLPEDYAMCHAMLLERPGTLTLNDTEDTVKRFAAMQFKNVKTTKKPAIQVNNVVHDRKRKPSKGAHKPPPAKNGSSCKFCERGGHTHDKCYINPDASVFRQDYALDYMLKHPKSVGAIRLEAAKSVNPQIFLLRLNESSSKYTEGPFPSFIVDSGATHHVSGTIIPQNMTTNDKRLLTLADNSVVPSLGTGSI